VGNIVSITQSIALPAITIIIPAFNESLLLIDTVESALKSKYPNTFITVINPSSTDDMLKKLIDKYQLYPITPLIQTKIKTNGAVKEYYVSKLYKNLTVINKEHTDRSDTINVGVNACQTPLFMTLDADTLIEPDAINNILFYMLCNAHMIAAGGAVFVLNGCLVKDGTIISPNMSGKPLYAFQTCEYLRSFYFDKVGWNAFGGALSYAGAFTLFDVKIVITIGGYQIGNLAQDFEIITHLHEYARANNIPYKIGYTPTAAVWTDVPGTVKTYWKQRYNWQYSILQSLMSHKKMLFNPKFGVVGLFTYPFFLFGETLSAIVEFTAYLSVILTWYLGILNVTFAFLLFLLC
jgi:cellulose synthase/poly-beta-1,6-N-acetylglucosamine synthase-like glycosyltransferase